METLFATETAEQPWVVRHAVTGHVYLTSEDSSACEQWCADHPDTTYLVIERADSCLPFDAYAERDMLRNVPGMRKRKPVSAQLGLFG